jgi:hypothetical protein
MAMNGRRLPQSPGRNDAIEPEDKSFQAHQLPLRIRRRIAAYHQKQSVLNLYVFGAPRVD